MSPAVNPDPIPDELKQRDQWLLWDNSHSTPRQPHWRGDFQISWSNPDDWHSFEDAVAAAEERDSWGIGYVMAKDNPDHPRGLYGCLDFDGCLEDATTPKDWLPSLERFIDGGAYIERSPGGDGLHIPLVGQDAPDWWTDSHFSDDEHEGVEYLTHKFCTFTGDVLFEDHENVVADTDPTPFLLEAYKTITGDHPRLEGDGDAPSTSTEREWSADEIEDALDHINPACGYAKWRNIGFALHDWDSGTQGKALFEDWSRGGGWDEQSQRYIDAIWDSASEGEITLGTLIYHAKDGGWSVPGSSSQPTTAAEEATDDGDDEPDAGPESLDIRERVAMQVLDPLNTDPDAPGESIDNETARDRLAAILDSEYHFIRPREDTRGWRDTLYVYHDGDGIYEPHGETFVETEVEKLVGAWATNQRVNEIVKKIERRNRVNKRRLEADPERLVVRNGILELTTGELYDHTPEEYHQTMVDVPYHPEAECPDIDEFLHDVVEDKDVQTLYRLIAHCLYKEYAAEKAAMLLGDGRNGKSVFLSVVEEFLGEWNVSNQSLQDLNEDEWSANNLVGKLANVHPDMSDQTVDTMQMFKKLTGRDTVSANVKFEEPVRFENYATMMFACNRMPVLKDDTRGNWRRWLLIDFPYTFEPGAEDTEPKHTLMNRLTKQSELQGLLVKCVEEIKRWAEEPSEPWFPGAPDWKETRRRIRRAAEPVYDFAHACLMEDDDGFEITDEVRRCYQHYAEEEGLPSISREQFGKKLLSQTDFPIDNKQRRVDGARRQVYDGVVFTNRARDLLGSGTEEETHDRQQSGFGGAQGSASTVIELCDHHANGSGVPHDMLVGLAVAEGMGREKAEGAIQKARNQGDLMDAPDGSGLIPT